MRAHTTLVLSALVAAASATWLPRNPAPAEQLLSTTASAHSSSVLSKTSSSSLTHSLSSTKATTPTTRPSSSSKKATSTAAHSSSTSLRKTTSSKSHTSTATSKKVVATSSSMGSGPSSPINQCSLLCSTLHFSSDLNVTPISCESYSANSNITIEGGQATSQCGTTIQPELDLCRVALSITTSYASQTYVEVWMPNGNSTAWNGRSMSTDNGGLNGCVHYVDMQYVTGLGFAAIGDNGGHNSSAFDGSWMFHENEEIIDWVARARHESVAAGKQVITQFYDRAPNYAYYLGCSTGGAQGLHSAQYYPDDFDGIIAGSSAADFNHLQDWSARFVEMTGTNDSDPRFLTYDNWLTVQQAILDQCDEPIDHVPDQILEDPTICPFNSSVLACSTNNVDGCLTDTQVTTVDNVFSPLFSNTGDLLFPALLYGSEIDAYRLGQLDGSIQGIAHDFFAYGVYNNSNFNVLALNQTDYTNADNLDAYHGNISSYNGDLSAFRASGGKMIMYHGLADPLVAGTDSQRYYQKVSKTMGLDYPDIDPWMRLFRISGMAHCGVGGIAGAGAWMFGQNGEASIGVDNIVLNMVDWVENGNAPETIVGTKYWYDVEAYGIEFERPHCRFPFRTTYTGGNWNLTSAWNCTFIEDWQECAGANAMPETCNASGDFA